MNKVFVSDLDGTLLDNQGKLSDTSRMILTQLLNDGVNFTIASARSIETIRAVIKDLPLKLPIIEFNGSYISDYASGEKLIVNTINRKCNEEIYNIIDKHGVSMLISTHENGQDYFNYNGKNLKHGAVNYVNYRKSNGNQRLKDSIDFDSIIEKDIICFNIIDEEDVVKKIHDELKTKYEDKLEIHMMRDTYTDKWYWLNVADKTGTKGHALMEFKEMYLNENDILYVFGDNNNDLGMFEVADVPVAVKNSVELLKKLSKIQIGFNYEDSVAKFIYSETKKIK